MGSRRDRIANEKVVDFFVPQTLAIGTHLCNAVDVRAGMPVVGAPSGGAGREIHTNVLFALSIAAGWAAAGTLDFQVWTGDTAATCALYATGAQALATELEDLYLYELRDLQRWVQLGLVVAGAEISLCCIANVER
ncbi:unnamed protein product, partial [marine sediment metagenome]